MKYLNLKQVAEHYGVTPKTIGRWRRFGSFPKPISIGTGNRWTVEMLDKWNEVERRHKSIYMKTPAQKRMTRAINGLLSAAQELIEAYKEHLAE